MVARWRSLSTENGVYPTEISLNLYILWDLCLTIWHSLRGEKLAAIVCMAVDGSIYPTGSQSNMDVHLRSEVVSTKMVDVFPMNL